MLDYKMPVLLPLYLCRSNIFPNFVTDLKKLRAKNIIIAVDYDFNDWTYKDKHIAKSVLFQNDSALSPLGNIGNKIITQCSKNCKSL